MNADATVRRESLYIARWVLALSALTQIVFLVAGWWDYTVLLGNLLSGCAAVGNFFLMGRSVQKAVTQDQADAAKTMHASQQLRSLGLFVVAAVGVVRLVDGALLEGLLPRAMNALSLFERFYTFVNGIFDLTGIVYYLTVAVLFLFLTVQSMEKRRYH